MEASSFEKQLLSHQDSLLRFALRLTTNRDDAEDLLQETTLKAINNKSETNVNLKGWLFTIMRNLFINDYRKAAVRNTTVDNTQGSYLLNMPQDSGFATPDGSYTLKEINQAIRSFKDDHRIPFSMHVSGYKYKEIAKEMNLPIGTVKSRIFFARKQLSESLKDYQYKL
jgi:RNA polymerase sigma-70 factor (ECF subfamily)